MLFDHDYPDEVRMVQIMQVVRQICGCKDYFNADGELIRNLPCYKHDGGWTEREYDSWVYHVDVDN